MDAGCQGHFNHRHSNQAGTGRPCDMELGAINMPDVLKELVGDDLVHEGKVG